MTGCSDSLIVSVSKITWYRLRGLCHLLEVCRSTPRQSMKHTRFLLQSKGKTRAGRSQMRSSSIESNGKLERESAGHQDMGVHARGKGRRFGTCHHRRVFHGVPNCFDEFRHSVDIAPRPFGCSRTMGRTIDHAHSAQPTAYRQPEVHTSGSKRIARKVPS